MSSYNSIILAGATAVGKTDLSIKLAKLLNMDIISADATQVYKELNIGSAKITEDEKQGIKHYMIDIISPDDKYTVARYYEDVNKILNDNQDKEYIITGGTGLYIQSITEGMTSTIEDKQLREYLEKLSLEELVKLAYDRKLSDNLDLKNKPRVIRRLETGIIEHNNIKGNDRTFLKIFLTRDREHLYTRINKRVDLMFDKGLLEEARYIYEKYGNNISAIGYKELFLYFNGEISFSEAVELIKRNSRRYAKRQFTWFRNKGYIEFNLDNITENELIEKIRSIYENK